MSKILAIDYGSKRCGLAETDSLQIIASGLETIERKQLDSYLEQYIQQEKPECLVIGEAKRLHGEPSAIESDIRQLISRLGRQFPTLKIERQDERFTSKLAMDSMIRGGVKKKKRQDKSLVEKVSAPLILQAYLERIQR